MACIYVSLSVMAWWFSVSIWSTGREPEGDTADTESEKKTMQEMKRRVILFMMFRLVLNLGAKIQRKNGVCKF